MERDPLEYVLNRMENAAHSANPSGSGYAAARVELMKGITALRAERDAALEEIKRREANTVKDWEASTKMELDMLQARHDRDAAIAERDALREKYETPEPGQLIAEISCPSCGRPLRVEHGDDEGEIGVLTND